MFAIYIHWPYCLSKCPYCDFNSHVRPVFNEQEWLDGVIDEITAYKNLLEHNIPQVTSIFFGGGTPSLMSPKTVNLVLECLFANFNSTANVEITLEANPNSAESNRFKDFKSAGINRISIGIQSFDQAQLEFLGRKHSADEGVLAIHNAQQYFDRVSFDLIYALPQQTLVQWEKMLSYALSFGTSHLSLYQLTIEPDTPFESRYKRREFQIPLDEESAVFYEHTVDQMTEAGLPPYEVSNFAKIGQACLHNLCYWQYNDYIGIGPGAHGRFMHQGQKYHIENQRVPELWGKDRKALGYIDLTTNSDCRKIEVLSPKHQVFERLMMGLRLYQGIPIPQKLSGFNFGDLIQEKYLKNDANYLIPTQKGILCHGSIVNYLTDHLS